MEVSRHWYLALKALAGLRNLSAAKLSERSGVNVTSVRSYLRGPENFELETLEKLLRGLDVEIFDVALMVTLLKKLDKEEKDRTLPLFEVAESTPPSDTSEASPEFLRLFVQVQWLYEEMQRQLRGKAYSIEVPRFDITNG